MKTILKIAVTVILLALVLAFGRKIWDLIVGIVEPWFNGTP